MKYAAKTASIIIPTYKRPKDIIRALKSVANQHVDGINIDIIIADNDPEASAKSTITAYIKNYKSKNITYTHVPNPGVSNARNGALEITNSRYILFLDDDMEATEHWARELISTSTAYKAAICFSPIDAIMPTCKNPIYPYIQPLFSRKHQNHSGIIPVTFGTGGCLIDRELCTLPTPAFNPDMNETGGEDNVLFEYLLTQNINVAWAASASTYEHVPLHRTTSQYVWKRQFAYGQSPCQDAATRGLKGTFGIIKWMLIGCIQTILRFPPYFGLKVLNKPQSITAYAKLAQAVGKIFWWGNFTPKFYGLKAAET